MSSLHVLWSFSGADLLNTWTSRAKLADASTYNHGNIMKLGFVWQGVLEHAKAPV